MRRVYILVQRNKTGLPLYQRIHARTIERVIGRVALPMAWEQALSNFLRATNGAEPSGTQLRLASLNCAKNAAEQRSVISLAGIAIAGPSLGRGRCSCVTRLPWPCSSVSFVPFFILCLLFDQTRELFKTLVDVRHWHSVLGGVARVHGVGRGFGSSNGRRLRLGGHRAEVRLLVDSLRRRFSGAA